MSASYTWQNVVVDPSSYSTEYFGNKFIMLTDLRKHPFLHSIDGHSGTETFLTQLLPPYRHKINFVVFMNCYLCLSRECSH